MVKFKNIIFDLDGTLIDSSPDIIQSLVSAYLKESISNINFTRYHIGPKLDAVIDILTPGIDGITKSKVIANFRSIYDHLEEKKTVLYTSVFECLEKLKEQKHSLFIATNKPQSATIPLLKYFKIDTYFTDVLTPTSVEGKNLTKTQMVSHIIDTYHLDKNQSVMIGDHHDDIAAAKNNGIASVAVLYGYSHQDALRQSQPDYEVNSFAEFLTLPK